MHDEIKRLYRTRDDAVLFGVCGGLGRYMNVDPVLIRLAWVVVTFLTAIIPAILAYLAAAVIVPLEPMARQPEAPRHEPPPGSDPLHHG